MRKFKFPEWSYSTLFAPTFFFGMYHIHDYKRFVIHRGKRIVFWCGSDILNLNKWNKWIFRLFTARHYCENVVECKKLLEFGIVSTIQPLFLDNPLRYKIGYKHSSKPHIWLCMHDGRTVEYGLPIVYRLASDLPEYTFHVYGLCNADVGNIRFHKCSDEQLNKEIVNYQAGLRLNEFDGFSEVIAKSILLGQYPISRIKYDWIDSFSTYDTLLFLLKELKLKEKPNYMAMNYWHNELQKTFF